MDKPTFYGIIPANVRYAKIADRAKLIFSEITALSNKWGYCNASNGYFAQVWECDPSVISRHISSLESIGAIRCEYIREGKQVKERRIYPLAMGGVLHPVQEGIASDAKGVLHGVQWGIAPEVKDNTTRVNNTSSNNKKPQKEISIQVNEEFEGMKLTTNEIIPSIQLNPTPPLAEAPPAPKKVKRETKYIYPPTIEELVPLFYEKLEAKKREHPNIVDTWNNANMQAEKFFIWQESDGWKVKSLPMAIAKWLSNAMGYGQLTKPCPVQYKGKPQPTPQPRVTYREEKPVFTQSDIEASEQYSNAAADVFKSLGVIMKNT